MRIRLCRITRRKRCLLVRNSKNSWWDLMRVQKVEIFVLISFVHYCCAHIFVIWHFGHDSFLCLQSLSDRTGNLHFFVISIILFFYFIFWKAMVKINIGCYIFFIIKTVDMFRGVIPYPPDILQISPIMYHT